MNKFIYLAAIVLFCIGFSSCEKEETREFIDFEKRQKSRETFFRSGKTKSTDDFSLQIINFLKYIDDRTHFTEEFTETYGRPWWDICKTTYTKNTALRIVPIIDVDEIHISGLQFFGYRNHEFISFFILNDECAIKTLKNDKMRTLYSNLILNYERVLSKQRLKEVRVVGNGNCYSTFVDDLWIKTECDLDVTDWEPDGPKGPNPEGPGEPGEPNGSGSGHGNSEPIGGGTAGGSGVPGNGGIPECEIIDGVCHITGWLENQTVEVPEDLVPEPLLEVLPTPEFLANQKLKCIWEILNRDNTSFQRYLKQFDNDFSIIDLEFDISNSLPTNVNGRTDNSYSNKILISINGSTLENRPVLGVARTLIHEAIHAELYRKVRSVNNQISINDFPGIYDYYRRYIKNWQHQQMAAHYIDLMGKMLKEFDGSKMSDQYYRDISWNGLYMVNDKNNPGNLIYTVAFNNLSLAERTRILNNIKNLKENGTKECN